MNDDRYQRHSLIDWFSQDLVRSAKFAIIGCGAVGNEVAKNMALLGVGNLDLYDFDIIELHNLTRSVLFREKDVGKTKVDVAAARVKGLDPNISAIPFFGDFWDSLSFEKASSYDTIICCVDNFEARIKLNQLCQITSTNLINTGIDSKYGIIELYPFKEIPKTACYECNLPTGVYKELQKRFSCGWLKKVSYIEKKIPTTIITSSIVGSYATALALNILRDSSNVESKKIFIDSFTGNSTISGFNKNKNCPNCTSEPDGYQIIKAKSNIHNTLNSINISDSHSITTSEPILVSTRCVNCDSSDKIIFDLASKYDSTIIRCPKCNQQTVNIDISDIFSINELLSKYENRKLPCKFIRYEQDGLLTIIELEHCDE